MGKLTPISSAKISSTNDTLLVYLPGMLVRLLDLQKGEYLEVFADVENGQVILRKTGFIATSRRSHDEEG